MCPPVTDTLRLPVYSDHHYFSFNNDMQCFVTSTWKFTRRHPVLLRSFSSTEATVFRAGPPALNNTSTMYFLLVNDVSTFMY